MKASRDETNGKWSLEGVEDSEITYQSILHKIRIKEPFCFSRFGDGEFNAMLGRPGNNCDGHAYFPDMGVRLKDIFLSSPSYMVGIQPLSVSQEKYSGIISQCQSVFVNADTIHNANIEEKLGRFFEELKLRKVVLVGPKHLSKLGASQIIIPDTNCWLYYDQIKVLLNKTVNEFIDCVVLLCASMMSEILIEDFKNSGHTFIDMGSALDPHVGVKSRRYHHKMNIFDKI